MQDVGIFMVFPRVSSLVHDSSTTLDFTSCASRMAASIELVALVYSLMHLQTSSSRGLSCKSEVFTSIRSIANVGSLVSN